MSNSNKAQAAIKRFARAPKSKAMDLVRCGLELEFHSVTGIDLDSDEDSEVDYELLSERSCEAAGDEGLSQILENYCGRDDADLKSLALALIANGLDPYGVKDEKISRKLEDLVCNAEAARQQLQ
jgi:hypothetical protein